MCVTRKNYVLATRLILLATFFGVVSSGAVAQEDKKVSRAKADMEDPSRSLWITVESVPSGATIYGVRDGRPTRTLGTTPITFKYVRTGRNKVYGHMPSETLEFFEGGDDNFLAFKCIVVKDGYAPYSIYQVIEKRHTIWHRGLSLRLDSLKGGAQRTFTALLEPIGRQSKSPGLHSSPQQQVQQRNQEAPQQERGLGQALVTLSQLGLLLGNNNPQTVKATSLLNTVGRMEFERELVERGSNLNININQGHYQQNVRGYALPDNVLYDEARGRIVPAPGYSWVDPTDPNDLRVQRSLRIFASYPWIDFNRNGTVDFPDEFPAYGQKEFYSTERVIFVLHDAESQGVQRQIKWEIYNPQGEASASRSLTTSMGNVKVGQESEENLTAWLVENGGYGTHTIVWYVNDYPVGSTQVRIIPAPEKK